jgi:hypothetical protein
MAGNFTWIPLYSELAHHLVGREHLQSQLIEILEQLRTEGVKVTPLTDQDADGRGFCATARLARNETPHQC